MRLCEYKKAAAWFRRPLFEAAHVFQALVLYPTFSILFCAQAHISEGFWTLLCCVVQVVSLLCVGHYMGSSNAGVLHAADHEALHYLSI